jgi:HTH-type transcriptional regulator, competence development regulator
LNNIKKLSIFMKKLRLNNNDQTMSDMAHGLGISISYLSSVENGKRTMTDEMIEKISSVYHLTNEQTTELRYLRDLASDKLNVTLDGMDDSTKSTTVKFLSSVDKLSAEDLKKIDSIIKKNKG